MLDVLQYLFYMEEQKSQTIVRGETPQKEEGMRELLQSKDLSFSLPKVGDIVEGRVIEKGRNKIYIDLGPIRTGVVYKSEIDLSLYDMHGVEVGDVIPAKIIEIENEEGFVELSLREAGLDKVWQDLIKLKEEGTVFKVTIQDANRGGLIAQVKGIQAFLPVSQLSPDNYPHVDGGDKEQIFQHLKGFAGKEIEVKILDLNRKTSKLILSERAKASKEIKEKLDKYSTGQVIEGEVSGIVDFGAFVTFDGIEGLVHISELGWQLVEHPQDVVSVGEKIKAKIISIENDKVSLSLKALKPNPWDKVAETYKKGDIVKGTVSKFNPFGAFVKVGPEIQGLVHISEFEDYNHMTKSLEINKEYDFRITILEPGEYKMALHPIILDTAPAREIATEKTQKLEKAPASEENNNSSISGEVKPETQA